MPPRRCGLVEADLEVADQPWGDSDGRRPGLRVEGLRAGYGERVVLSGLSLALSRRSITAIVGPGGSGKTTLARSLRAEGPEDFWWSGTISPGDLRCRALPQQLRTDERRLASLIVAGGVEPVARARVVDVWGADSFVARALIGHLAWTPAEVSPWLRRMAGLTRVVSCLADLYVLDEPEAELPAAAIDSLVRRLRLLVPEATVVVVTHHLSLARALADEIV